MSHVKTRRQTLCSVICGSDSKLSIFSSAKSTLLDHLDLPCKITLILFFINLVSQSINNILRVSISDCILVGLARRREAQTTASVR